MSEENKILDRLDSMDHRLAAIETSLTGHFGRRGMVGDLIDHEKRLSLIERERERAKGIMVVIGGLAGVFGTIAVTLVKQLFA